MFELISQFPPAAQLDRFGSEAGRFLGANGDLFPNRSLPPASAAYPYFRYIPNEPLPPDLKIVTGEIAEWFGVDGGGTQFQIIKVDPATGQPILRDPTKPSAPRNYTATTVAEMLYRQVIEQIYPPSP